MNDPNQAANQWNIYTDVMTKTDLLAAAGARTSRATRTMIGLGTANR